MHHKYAHELLTRTNLCFLRRSVSQFLLFNFLPITHHSALQANGADLVYDEWRKKLQTVATLRRSASAVTPI